MGLYLALAWSETSLTWSAAAPTAMAAADPATAAAARTHPAYESVNPTYETVASHVASTARITDASVCATSHGTNAGATRRRTPQKSSAKHARKYCADSNRVAISSALTKQAGSVGAHGRR